MKTEMELSFQQELSDVKQKIKKEKRYLFIKRIRGNRLIVVGGVIVLLILLFTLFAPLIAVHSPSEIDIYSRLQAPSSTHIFGTDDFGRDLFARVAHGGKSSLMIGLSVTLISSICGMVIGLYATYYRPLDHVFMRIADGLSAIPGVLLAIALTAALGPNLINVIIALSIVFIPQMARIIRSAAVVIREETYIEAMKAQRASSFRIIWGHIMPNTISVLIVQATFVFANAIVTEATLSFLGAGVPAPLPSWGNIIHDGQTFIYTAWWMIVFPGVFIILSVLGLNLLGDGLRDFLDPKSTGNK